MVSTLTDRRLGLLPPGEYTDPAVKGLQVRIRKDRNGKLTRSWFLRYKWQGQPIRISLGVNLSLAVARREALAARSLIDRGIDPRTGERRSQRQTARTSQILKEGTVDKGHTIEYLVQEYLNRHVQRHRKQPKYVERFLKAEVLTASAWASRDVRTITPREVIELLDTIVDRGAPTMANRGAGILSQMFRFGVHRAIVPSSPVQLLYRPGGKEKPRERVLRDDEISFLLRHIDGLMRFNTDDPGRSPRLAHALRILLLTGQRRGELGLSRWKDLELSGSSPQWRIPAEHSKTGAPHTVPLSQAVIREFQALRRYANDSEFVLPTRDGNAASDPRLLTRGLARNLPHLQALAKTQKPPLKLEPFTVHDLRRTCRTGLARLGVNHETAERVLNHKLPAMRAVYDRHEPLTEMRGALDQWAAHLARLEATPLTR
jgi:integrase